MASLALYAVFSYRRFPRMSQDALVGYRLQVDNAEPSFLLPAIGAGVWMAALWALGSRGNDILVGSIWAGTIVAVVVFIYRENSRPSLCETCGEPTEVFLKANGRGPSEMVYLHVCRKCKVYGEKRVFALVESS